MSRVPTKGLALKTAESPSVNDSSSDSTIEDNDVQRTVSEQRWRDFTAGGRFEPLLPGVAESLGLVGRDGGGGGGATLVWRDVSVYVKLKGDKLKRLVNNVSGAVKDGTLVALMGSSGAGKSTLMTALAYRNSAGTIMEGDVLMNGQPAGDFMQRETGFMHQEDIFVESLTVLEHMNIMCHLRLDHRTSRAGRQRRVNQLLRQLGLYDCRHTRIGQATGPQKSLSGGERKRLAFASELLTDPSILFCDEPTTGLDSFSAQRLVRIMRSMAAQGTTIVSTIHQPSSELFAMFDKLILLAEGRIAFSGTARGALAFFESQGYRCPLTYNPADFFIEVLALTPGSEAASKHAIKTLCDQFAVSDAAKEVNLDVQYEFHVSQSVENSASHTRANHVEPHSLAKLMWLVYRYTLVIIRDPRVQLYKILQKLAIALTAGMCYVGSAGLTQAGVQAVQGALFIIIAENTFSPMYAVLHVFPDELPLLQRELQAGLYPAAIYYVARIVATLPGLLVESSLFTLVVYWVAGLRASFYAFSMTVFLAALVLNVSIACGSFFSCALGSMPVAIAYLVPFDYSLMITSGIFLKLSTIPNYISWIRHLSWLMYSNEAMSILQWEGIQNISCQSAAPQLPCISSGAQVLQHYDFQLQRLWADVAALAALYLAFHLLAFFCLRQRALKK